MNLAVRCAPIRHLEEYIGECKIRNTERFHKQDTKNADHQGKRLINLTTVDEFLFTKKTRKSKSGKIFRTYVIDKGLIFKIYKELLMGL